MSNHTQTATDSRSTFGPTEFPTVGMDFDTSGNLELNGTSTMHLQLGGTEVMEYSSASSPVAVVELAITGGAASSGVFASLANPFGYDVMIMGAYLQITTQSSGASTLDIGIGADATTSDDTLIDGLSGAAAGLFTNFEDAGTNGEVSKLWTSSTFLNVAEASGDVDALVATLRVLVVKA